MAPSLGALEAKVQGHDNEYNDREEQELDPRWANQQEDKGVMKVVRKTKDGWRLER